MVRKITSYLNLNKNKPDKTIHYARIPKDFWDDVKNRVPVYDSEVKAIFFLEPADAEKVLKNGYIIKVEILPPPQPVITRRAKKGAKRQAETPAETGGQQVTPDSSGSNNATGAAFNSLED